MSIFTKFFGKQIETIVKGIRQPFTTSLSSLQGMIQGITKGKKDYLSEYKNWQYACITARSEDVAGIELQLYKGDEEIFEHPLLDLINQVNPTMTKNDLFLATQAFKDLDGNAFWFLARDERKDGMGEVREIYMLRPDKVQIVIDKDNPLVVKGYVYTQADGKKIPFEPSEIIHHKNFNPMGNHPIPHKGMGVVEAAYASINTDNEMRKYNTAFFMNSARPDGMLIPDGESAMSQAEYQRLKAEWEEEHKGSANAYKVAIMQGGLKWQEIGRSQADMQFIDQLRASRDEILAMFRVPKTLVGIADDVNRANADAAIYVFSLKVIKPLMQRIVDTMNEFLVPNFDEGKKDKLVFKFKSPVPDDTVAMLAEDVAAIDKWKTRNEIRAAKGLPPTVNGDQFMGTFSQMPIDNVTGTKKPKPSATKPKEKPEKKTEGSAIVDKFLSKKFVGKLPEAELKGMKEVTGLAKTQYVELWKNFLVASGAPLKKKLNTYFDKQEAQVLKNVKEELKGLDVKEFKLKGLADMLFDTDEAVTAGITLITPFIKEYIKKSGEQATVLAGGVEFDNETALINEFIPKRARYFAETINETTAKNLVETIQEGIDNSEDLDAISERVAEVYGKARDFRTDMIARTEVSAASNFGAVQAYQQAGITKHQWVVVDPKDEDCLANDNAIVKIGESFPDGSVQPPDPHPNCECTTIPVFEDGTDE